MEASVELMRRTREGVLIQGNQGEVLLMPAAQGLSAAYVAGPLVNGSALAYAQTIQVAALRYAKQLSLPWRLDAEGGIKVTDPHHYYEDCFRPEVHAAETLLRWVAVVAGPENS